MTEIINDIFSAYCQEAVLIIAIFSGLIFNFILGKKFFPFSKYFSITALIIAIISSLKIQIIPTYYAFNGAYVSNFYTVFFKILILISALLILILSKNILLKKRTIIYDSYNLILLSTLGAITLVSANDFLTMFIASQLLGLSIFTFMLFFKNSENKKTSVKYIINLLISSLITLWGISFIYMSTGSLNFDVLYSFLNNEINPSPFFDIGCILCAIGLTFFACIIPFSNWTADIFEKTGKKGTLFLSLIPLLASFGLISRLIVYIFQYTPMLQALLFIAGILSIYKGILGLVRQDNLFGFMGYSVSVQAGFILLGFCISNPYAVSTSLFYILAYIPTIIGFFICLNIFLAEGQIHNISDLKGLAYTNKPLSILFSIFLFSLAGLPVTAGFWAKIYMFEAIIKCTNLYLLFLGIIMIATIIGIFTYLRPIKEMFNKSENIFISSSKLNTQKLLLFVFAIITVAICIFPDKLIQLCQIIAYQL